MGEQTCKNQAPSTLSKGHYEPQLRMQMHRPRVTEETALQSQGFY